MRDRDVSWYAPENTWEPYNMRDVLTEVYREAGKCVRCGARSDLDRSIMHLGPGGPYDVESVLICPSCAIEHEDDVSMTVASRKSST